MSQVRTNSLVPVGGIPAGASGGGIIQVVQTVKTDTFSSNTSNTHVDVTGLSVSITPRSTSNKILVICEINQGVQTYGGHTIRLLRGSSNILLGDAAGTRNRGSTASPYGDIYTIHSQGITYLDSPATTSSTTYKIQVYAQDGYRVHVNRNDYDDNRVYDSRTTSSITVLEVSG